MHYHHTAFIIVFKIEKMMIVTAVHRIFKWTLKVRHVRRKAHRLIKTKIKLRVNNTYA